MNLDALGNIGDFIGGIGVVVTLVYLAIQIRYNTRGLDQSTDLMRFSAESEIRHNLLQLRLAIAADAELSEIWTRGLRGAGELDVAEAARFQLLAYNLILMMSGQFEANRRGLYEFTQAPYFRLVAASPGFRAFWSRNIAEINRREEELGLPSPNPEFVEYVEALLRPEEEGGG